MTFCIAADSCISCGDCKNACPVRDAIIAGASYAIDARACSECGVCVEICPTSSIYALRPETADSAQHVLS